MCVVPLSHVAPNVRPRSNADVVDRRGRDGTNLRPARLTAPEIDGADWPDHHDGTYPFFSFGGTTMGFKPIRWILLVVVACAQVSCCWRRNEEFFCDVPCDEPLAPSCGPGQLEIDDPCPTACCDESVIPPPPTAIPANGDIATLDLTLEQAITIALDQSRVLRDLGGTVLRLPALVPTVFDPALAYTDPRFGEEAALSAFDATFSARGSWQRNDRLFNNTFIGDNGTFKQDLNNYEFEVSKRAATGTQMAFRHVIDYDLDNSVGNRQDPSLLWGAYFDAEVRHPLMQGSGVLFNRVAGPVNRAGVMNGVLIARIRTDIDLAEFEVGVRDLVSNVENAYWDLYFAYRDLDAKKRARDQALEMWAEIEVKRRNEEASTTDEAQAQEQYWRFQAEVLDAFNGRVVDATRTNNGSAAGTFRNSGGVRVAERRLRLMIGLPINGDRIIKPISEPPAAPSNSIGRQVPMMHWRSARNSVGNGGSYNSANWSSWRAATSCCHVWTLSRAIACAALVTTWSPKQMPTCRALLAEWATSMNGSSASSLRCRSVTAALMPAFAMPNWPLLEQGASCESRNNTSSTV